MRREYMKSRRTHYRWIQTALTFNPMARKFLLLPIECPFLLSPILTDLSNQWRSCCRMKITTYRKVIICLKHRCVRRFNFYFIVYSNYKLTQLFHNITKSLSIEFAKLSGSRGNSFPNFCLLCLLWDEPFLIYFIRQQRIYNKLIWSFVCDVIRECLVLKTIKCVIKVLDGLKYFIQ
jgi:hypothetical protein